MRFKWLSDFCKRGVCLKDYILTRMVFIGFMSLVLSLTALSFAKDGARSTPLDKIHQKIVTDYPDVAHISRAELEGRLTSDGLIIFDTRPLAEYNVSHIPGALQIDPNVSPEEFSTKFSQELKNKQVIVYCSVGRRSSNLGDRIQSLALSAGAVSVQNMEGGLFGWHNDNRPLVNSAGKTSSIHPYNAYWGRLIENKDDIHYRP